MNLEITLWPNELTDISKFESGTKIATYKDDNGYGIFVLRNRHSKIVPEFIWLPKKGVSCHLECNVNLSRLDNNAFKTYIESQFNILLKTEV